MISWNDTYRGEAEAIAASVVGERGYLWKATQIESGRRPRSEEVEIAMRALMFARGEFELEATSYAGRYDFQKRFSSSRE